MIFLWLGIGIIVYLILGMLTLVWLKVATQNLIAGVLAMWLWPFVAMAIIVQMSVQGMFLIFMKVKNYVKTMRLRKM